MFPIYNESGKDNVAQKVGQGWACGRTRRSQEAGQTETVAREGQGVMGGSRMVVWWAGVLRGEGW